MRRGSLFARREAIKNIVLVPPLVELSRKVAGGGSEQLKGEADHVASILTDRVMRELSQRGFRVVSGQDDVRFNEPTHAKAIQDAYQKLDVAIWSRFPEPASQALNYKFSLRQDVSNMAVKSSTEALVFVKFSGFTRSGGDVASEYTKKTLIGIATLGLFIPPGDPTGGAVLGMAIVDVPSGDVLWGNRAGKSSHSLAGFDFHEKELAELIKDLFAEFPQ